MTLEVRKNCSWSLVVPTSMGVRITPVGGQPVHSSDTFVMQVTSAETNVASIASYLGLPVKVLTTFVKGSPIARLIKSNLASRHMAFEGREVEQGGPWGHRHQFNIADSGAGSRGPRVHNDRAGEVGRTLNVKDFDLERIFGKEGVQILHLSGLIAALSPETGTFCLELARAAKKHGTRISFDINYRESFWQNRETELRAAFSEIAGVSDILLGNETDFQNALGFPGPKKTEKNVEEKEEEKEQNIDRFKAMIVRVRETYPNASVYGTTLREELSANVHLWGAILACPTPGSTGPLAEKDWHVVKPREIHVLDRIGGGDGFVGGMLYAILRGWKPEQWIQFGWATGALATTHSTDYAQPTDEDQVWSIWLGRSAIKR
jgi:2-dehydro-3-deoxygluconokinase